MELKAIIFDLDGVIVSTDEYHYLAWKRLADEEMIPYNKEANIRQRGVSRMESLDIILENATKSYTQEQKQEMANRKNGYYIESIKNVKPIDILQGVMTFLDSAKNHNIKCAIGSSSKNAKLILEGIGLIDYFDAIADGNGIKNSKPFPDVFLLAADLLNIPPKNCAVVEDADAGIEAARAAGMLSIAVEAAYMNEKADLTAKTLKDIEINNIIEKMKKRV